MNIDRDFGRLGVRAWTQWDFLWSRLNWYDFTFIQVEFENDIMFGNYEVTLAFLGFGVMLTWNYKKTEYASKIRDRINEIASEPRK